MFPKSCDNLKHKKQIVKKCFNYTIVYNTIAHILSPPNHVLYNAQRSPSHCNTIVAHTNFRKHNKIIEQKLKWNQQNCTYTNTNTSLDLVGKPQKIMKPSKL